MGEQACSCSTINRSWESKREEVLYPSINQKEVISWLGYHQEACEDDGTGSLVKYSVSQKYCTSHLKLHHLYLMNHWVFSLGPKSKLGARHLYFPNLIFLDFLKVCSLVQMKVYAYYLRGVSNPNTRLWLLVWPYRGICHLKIHSKKHGIQH